MGVALETACSDYYNCGIITSTSSHCKFQPIYSFCLLNHFHLCHFHLCHFHHCLPLLLILLNASWEMFQFLLLFSRALWKLMWDCRSYKNQSLLQSYRGGSRFWQRGVKGIYCAQSFWTMPPSLNHRHSRTVVLASKAWKLNVLAFGNRFVNVFAVVSFVT